METQEYHVEGPVAIVFTTTSIDIDEELIDTIALLHQHQRETIKHTVNGREVEMLPVMIEDIEAANQIAPEVLGRSLDELPPQTRSLLDKIKTLVREKMAEQKLEQCYSLFSRRELRDRHRNPPPEGRRKMNLRRPLRGVAGVLRAPSPNSPSPSSKASKAGFFDTANPTASRSPPEPNAPALEPCNVSLPTSAKPTTSPRIPPQTSSFHASKREACDFRNPLRHRSAAKRAHKSRFKRPRPQRKNPPHPQRKRRKRPPPSHRENGPSLAQ